MLFGPTTAATKISICLTYLRLFPSKTNKWFNYSAIVVLICWGIACPLGMIPPEYASINQALTHIIVMLFMCWPISDQWNVFKAHKNCIDIQAFFIASAAINAATDCAVYLWPIHYLMGVRRCFCTTLLGSRCN